MLPNNTVPFASRVSTNWKKELGLSQEALSVDAEFDRSYMGGVERGEHNLTLMGLTKIAKALGVKPSELLAQAGF